MSVKRLKFPVDAVRSEQPIPHTQDKFMGMLYDYPLSKIPYGYSRRNINLIDYIDYKSVRPGTRRYTTVDFTTYENENAYCDQRKLGRVFWLRDDDIQQSDRDISSLTDVFYISVLSADFSNSVSRMVSFENEVFLANSNAIARIIYDEDNSVYYAYRINIPVPTVLITDVAETTTLIYVYRYIYSFSRIIKSGNNLAKVDRLADSASIVMETGTSKTAGVEKDFGEVAFGSYIDNVVTDTHVIGTLTCPATNREATHFSLYRTKNIGKESGGIDPDTGLGNNIGYYVWVADIPIAAAYVISAIDAGTRTLTTTAGSKELTPGDVGCTLEDTAGNTGVIEEYVDVNNVILTAGYTLAAGTPNIALGNGRVMTASQTGTTITRTAGGTFATSDVGRPFFWSDGGMSIIVSYTSANAVEALWSATHAAQAGTIADTTNGFTRQYNDTTLDDGGGEIRISLNDRIESAKDIYIPPRFFEPLPNKNICVAGHGFLVVADRDEATFYYSQIGAKKFWAGQYRPDHQYGESEEAIRDMKHKQGIVHIWMKAATQNLQLNVSQDVGNADVGESVVKLLQPYMTDPNVGCYHWNTIREIASGMYCLLTNEPGVRVFDGEKYSQRNYAIADNGVRAILTYLLEIAQNYNIQASYSTEGGYKLFIYRIIEA